MSVEQDIQKIEGFLTEIEGCVNRGNRNPQKQEEIAAMISRANAPLEQIMTAYSMKSIILSVQQVYLVSNFMERLHQAEDKLISLGLESKSRETS